jgi:hypothetical protein
MHSLLAHVLINNIGSFPYYAPQFCNWKTVEKFPDPGDAGLNPARAGWEIFNFLFLPRQRLVGDS